MFTTVFAAVFSANICSLIALFCYREIAKHDEAASLWVKFGFAGMMLLGALSIYLATAAEAGTADARIIRSSNAWAVGESP